MTGQAEIGRRARAAYSSPRRIEKDRAGKEKPAGVQSEGEVAWGDEPHRLASAE